MSAPHKVQLKRRWDELPPDSLIIQEPQSKRQLTQQQQESSRYVRQIPTSTKSAQSLRQGAETASDEEKLLQDLREYSHVKVPSGAPPPTLSSQQRRTFHLKRPAPGAEEARSKKRRVGDVDGGIATFVEAKRRATDQTPEGGANGTKGPGVDVESAQKRPGRGGRVQRGGGAKQSEGVAGIGKDQKRIEELASNLHEFALDQMSKDKKDKITAMPKLPPQRSRELHQSRMASAAAPGHVSSASPSIETYPSKDGDGDETMHIDSGEADEDESMYVYDTYYLVPSGRNSGGTQAPTPAAATPALHEHELGNVGYLVITDEDQPLWEMYMNDEDYTEERGDYNSDEDDENAEDYYGADYPEDEMASDDEFGRGAYGYRRGAGSDDEQWGEDGEDMTWSDEEELRMRNPFAQPARGRLAKYLNHGRGGEESDEDDVSPV